MSYVIGLDGGGTKTEAIAINQQGHLLYRYEGGATNPNSVTYSMAERHLVDILDHVLSQPTLQAVSCGAICLGLAGGGTADVQQYFTTFIEQYFAKNQNPFTQVIVTTDAHIALVAGLGREYGILVISGTGSIAFGITPEGKTYRTGGWGHLLGDQGSGYAIGLLTLQAAVRRYDGIGAETTLFERILQHHQWTKIDELKSYIYQPQIQKQHIADYARVSIEAAEQGDAIARQIIHQAADEMAILTKALVDMDEQFTGLPIVMSGSIFHYSQLFRARYIQQVREFTPHIEPRLGTEPAALGAAQLALQRLTNK